MKNALVLAVGLVLLTRPASAGDGEAATSNGYLDAGVGSVDITPTDPVVLAGSPTRLKSSSVGTRLYVKALVLAAGGQKVAIVTLDTLKYPVEHVVRARRQIEQTTGIPASKVIICAPHTHRGPLWSYYKDQLVTPIAEAVALAVRDLTPCRLGTSKGKGVMAKYLASPYVPGRRVSSWRKMKPRLVVPCVIIGYTAGRNGVHSLVVAAEREGVLQYAATLTLGLAPEVRARLGPLLARGIRPTPVVPCSHRATWVEPELYCQVRCLERTALGRLRSACFQGLLGETP